MITSVIFSLFLKKHFRFKTNVLLQYSHLKHASMFFESLLLSHPMGSGIIEQSVYVTKNRAKINTCIVIVFYFSFCTFWKENLM
jgi:hypothetical protein